MKRCLLCLLLAGAFFSLAAQTQTVSVYWPPVTGTGINQQDNDYFFMLIYRELEARDFITIGRSRASSDLTLSGALLPAGRNESTSLNEYRFVLSLEDNKTDQLWSEQGYRYSSLENADVPVKQMLENVYALIRLVLPAPPPAQPVQQPTRPIQPPTQPVQQPAQPVQQPTQPVQQPVQPVQQPTQPVQQPVVEPVQPVYPVQQPVQPVYPVQPPVYEPFHQPIYEPIHQPIQTHPQPVQPHRPNRDWRDRWVFLGFSAFWNPRIYNVLDSEEEGQIPYLGNYLFGFYPELHFLGSVSLETGLGLSSDWIRYGPKGSEEDYRDLILEVPLLVKIVLKPGDVFLLQPYSGVNLNFSLFRATRPPLLSWVAGYQHGVKAGPGAFLFNFCFSMDLGRSTLEKRGADDPPQYQRFSASFGVGYKFGLLQKR
jgi:hypothetical protein